MKNAHLPLHIFLIVFGSVFFGVVLLLTWQWMHAYFSQPSEPLTQSYWALMSMIRYQMYACFGLCSGFLGTIALLIYMDVKQRYHMEQTQRERDALQQSSIQLEDNNLQLRQAFERLKRLAVQAEVANAAKSEFLANTSHEIRTPMTAILGYIDILCEGCPRHCEFGSRELDNCVAVIRRSGGHLLQVINDILDISKIEAGRMDIKRTSCSPMQLMAEVRSLMSVKAEAKKLILRCRFEGPIPEKISADPMRIRQILVNLVGNAVKFTESGEVAVTGRIIHESDSSTKMCFEVRDTGIGIGPDQLKKLFRPFSQVDNSASRQFGGSGLGLAISKRLAEMMGGDIQVQSTIGVGSVFTVTIDPGPLDQIRMIDNVGDFTAASRIVPTVSTPKRPVLYGRILLAEDGVDNKRLVTAVLKKAGAEVVAVENGQLAIEKALQAWQEDRPFNVIIMDMQMPVMDGYSAVRHLRTKGYNGPIIALTANAMSDDRQKCLDAGCNDYLSKPIDRHQLIAVTAQHIASVQTPVCSS